MRLSTLSDMTWSASQRYDLDAAPGGLALIQDFLNTRARRNLQAPDLLATVRAAQDWANGALRQWSQDSGRADQKLKFTKADVDALRSLRSDLVAALRSRDAAHDSASSEGIALGGIGIRTVMTADGAVTLEPADQGWRRVGAAIMIEAYTAQIAGTWRRLKVCRNEKCPGAFYDRSPNNSGAWHDVRTCGNIANLRAARARRKAAAR
jgi:predicted RNA-binding Zn ribbon-like protein